MGWGGVGWGLKSESTAHKTVNKSPSQTSHRVAVDLSAGAEHLPRRRRPRDARRDFGLARQASERSGGGSKDVMVCVAWGVARPGAAATPPRPRMACV